MSPVLSKDTVDTCRPFRHAGMAWAFAFALASGFGLGLASGAAALPEKTPVTISTAAHAARLLPGQ